MLLSILSDRVMSIPELDGPGRMLFARAGFNVIATANTRDRGVNEMSAALKRRFNFETVHPIADLAEEMALVQRESDRLLRRAEVPVSLRPEITELLVTTFRELRAGKTADGNALEPLTTAMSTAEAVSAGFAAGIHAYYYGEGEVEPEHLVQHLVGTALKDAPDDLKKLRHYFNHVVKARRAPPGRPSTKPGAICCEPGDRAVPETLTEFDMDARVVFFPVRHHSPLCARVRRRAGRADAARRRPDRGAVRLQRPARRALPRPSTCRSPSTAIVRLADGSRRGAYYPFCVYSPEWQALQVGRELGADRPVHRPALGRGRRRRPLEPPLCRRRDARRALTSPRSAVGSGVDDFDALWDKMFEVEPGMTVEEYLRRGHAFCEHLRRLDGEPRPVDLRREAFMAAEIRRAMRRARRPAARRDRRLPQLGPPRSLARGRYDRRTLAPRPPPRSRSERGLALTPYSYERLDGLKGYESGMPNPGFYHQAWEDRDRGWRRRIAGCSRAWRASCASAASRSARPT